MSVVIRLKVPIEMHYTVIPMGTSKVNSSHFRVKHTTTISSSSPINGYNKHFICITPIESVEAEALGGIPPRRFDTQKWRSCYENLTSDGNKFCSGQT